MDKGQLYLQLRVSVSMTVMNNKGVFQELWNNFHFLTKEQIQGHHLVPFSLRGSHPSYLWSLRNFLETVSGLLSGPALEIS